VKLCRGHGRGKNRERRKGGKEFPWHGCNQGADRTQKTGREGMVAIEKVWYQGASVESLIRGGRQLQSKRVVKIVGWKKKV